MNFFLLLKNDPKMCEALIAHEFGHLLHEDIKLWHFNYIFSKVVRRIILPYAVIMFILKLSNYLYLLATDGNLQVIAMNAVTFSLIVLGISFSVFYNSKKP